MPVVILDTPAPPMTKRCGTCKHTEYGHSVSDCTHPLRQIEYQDVRGVRRGSYLVTAEGWCVLHTPRT